VHLFGMLLERLFCSPNVSTRRPNEKRSHKLKAQLIEQAQLYRRRRQAHARTWPHTAGQNRKASRKL